MYIFYRRYQYVLYIVLSWATDAGLENRNTVHAHCGSLIVPANGVCITVADITIEKE